ncbi:hypothetical protein KR067_006000 [Drosophila pandora]|nr:hypothetical protein KR067_006000 [Drosophila pandora]
MTRDQKISRVLRGIMLSRLWWLLILQRSILALPTDTEHVYEDDFNSDYAKQIIHAAKVSAIKAMMKPEVAPCDNFYEYACGNWHRHNPAQLFGILSTDTFKPLSGLFNRLQLRLLRSQKHQSELEQKLQRFFQSCSSVNRDDVLYKKAFESVYREFGEMPAVVGAQWDSSTFNWWRTEARIHRKYGKGLIIGVEIVPDIRNTSINTVYLSAPTRPGSALRDSRVFNALEEASTAKDLHNYLGMGANEAKNLAKNLYTFEDRLFKEPNLIENGVSLYSMAELEEKYISYLNFTEYFGLIFGEENIPEKLYIYNDEFLDNTLPLMKSTPLATQANYIIWHLLEEYLVDSNGEDLSKWCVGQTKKYFGVLPEHLVYNQYRSPKAEAEVFSVWEEIRSIFRDHLKGDNLDWITNATGQLAIEKLDNMELRINSHDTVDFEKLFGTVEIDRHNYVANIQHLLSAKAMETVREPKLAGTSKEATEMLSFTPEYNVQENSISIPVALLLPRYFWGDEYPEALKYATLGFLIAHEMVHGFEGDGRRYDASGHVARPDIRSRNILRKRKKCFRDQYHAYKYGESKLPLREDQSENMADSAGIKFAYMAYEKWLGRQTEERKEREVMKGLDLNSREIFFLGYAQLLCGDVHPVYQSMVAQFYEHAPSMYRVIGPLSNFQEFSRVHRCSQDALMNPRYKCAVY